MVRGRSAAEAQTILEHTPRKAAKAVSKVIASAVANAENNHGMKSADLSIAEITVTQGITMKRHRPAAHGRALPFRRRTSHIAVTVEGPDPVKKSETKPAAKKTATATKKPAAAKPATTKKEKK